MNFTPENVCGFLIRSRLMTPEEMRAMQLRWLAEAREQKSNLSHFTKWLVANQYVTDYQAGLLAKGHGDPEVYFLNQYKIVDRLGRGRMAGVYKAVHALGQVVAIKVLPPSRSKSPVMLGRFQREARLALKLKHPNVVRSFQIGEANGLYFLVMEYLDGETLEDVLDRRKRLPPPEAVRLIHQALSGLQHISELGMVHRDLKPSNLMLTPAPEKGEPDNTLRATVKILDIGLGRALFDEKETVGPDKVQLTGEGVLLGTPDYLAPEQARDPRSIDVRADIYSLGCVLYHTLTGQPPFPDKNLLNQLVRHADETPKPLQHFNPAIPDGLQQIVSYMLAKKPEQRYPTPERAAQALQMFLVSDSAAPKPVEEAPQMRKFLTWLETSSLDGTAPEPMAAPPPKPPSGNMPAAPMPAVAAAPVSPMPAAVPTAPVVRSKPAPSTRPGHKKHKKHRHKHPAAGQPAPVATPAGVEEEQFDVELVAMPPAAAPVVSKPESKRLFGLSKREWTLIGIGAGVLLLVGIIGAVVGVLLFRS